MHNVAVGNVHGPPPEGRCPPDLQGRSALGRRADQKPQVFNRPLKGSHLGGGSRATLSGLGPGRVPGWPSGAARRYVLRPFQGRGGAKQQRRPHKAPRLTVAAKERLTTRNISPANGVFTSAGGENSTRERGSYDEQSQKQSQTASLDSDHRGRGCPGGRHARPDRRLTSQPPHRPFQAGRG